MAKLRIKAADGKTLVVDVGDADPSEYDNLATAAVEDYQAKNQRPDWMNEPGLEDATVSTIKNLGTMTKAGISGIADLSAGNGLQKASENVGNVEEGKEPTTAAGYVGEKVGSLFTPEQIAMQAAIGPLLEATGIGPWMADAMKGWSEKAALAAIGYTKSIGKAIGLSNLDGLAQFLMTPVEIGGKQFPAIVSATNSTDDMLAAANAVKDAAGKQLGVVSEAVDAAIKDASEMGGNAPVAIDLAGLEKAAAELKGEMESVAPNLGKAVVNQYEAALKDIQNLIKKSLTGNSDTVFSDLSELKTTIGDLVYKHGSPLDSKAALNDVYHLVSDTLDGAAKNVGGKTGAAYDTANAVYHKAIAIVNALEGKALGSAAKGFFSDLSAMGTGLLAGFVNPLLAIPTAVGTHIVKNYGAQGVAAGLNAAAPLMSTAMQAGVRAVPVVGTAIASALNNNQ